ncbi:MAG: ShlB/FhaC/HecB family hemolysin secretion/activation protein [Elainellaceae cyanobacterium]
MPISVRCNSQYYFTCFSVGFLLLFIDCFVTEVAFAQPASVPADRPLAQERPRSAPRSPILPPVRPPSDDLPPLSPPEPLPEPPLQDELPPPSELLPQPLPAEPLAPGEIPAAIRVEQFEVIGSTIFSPEELAEVTEPFTGRDLSFAELLQVRSAITQYYVDRGYITSGAIIPPQTIADGVVTIQVIEGELEEINVTGTRRLNPSYVRSRLRLAGDAPLNVNRLLEGLQLLQLDPLIETISADLQAGIRPGTSVLQVQVTEADTFRVDLAIDNNRSPSVGSFQRQIEVSEANLLGLGDGLSISYFNTDGSNQIEAIYRLPVNPRNGTVQLAFNAAHSRVIEPPFDELDISSEALNFELSFRQPVFQSPTEEFALGITASRQESETELLDRPFPLSAGANEEGETRVSALRFVQEWVRRSSQDVVAVRSQFSFGLDVFDATINDNDQPDSQFFAWRGQGQWVRLLADDTLLLVRGDIQVADAPLLPVEQFGLGGAQSLRGYRQDFLLTDSGLLGSAEVRIPVLRVPELDGLLQVTPFFDIGSVWNANGINPDPGTLAGMGVGLLWQQSDTLSARIDFSLPLVSVDARERTWQESGVYFSVVYTPF